MAAARLSREGRILARLSHPNIVEIFDVFRDDDADDWMLVMGLVRGTDLRAAQATSPTAAQWND